MNKLFTKIGVAMVGLAMAVGVGVAAGFNNKVIPSSANSTNGNSESIVFSTAASDSTSATSTANVMSTLVSSNSLVDSCTDATKVYAGKNGIKFGTSSLIGSITLTISAGCQNYVKSISITSTRYGSDNGSLQLSTLDAQDNATNLKQITPGATGDDAKYTFATASTVSKIRVATTEKRAYLGSIQFTYEIPSGPKVNSVSLNKTSVKMDKNASTTATITVDADDGAEYTLSAATSDDTVATASITGTTLTVNSQNKYGNATITVSAGGKSAQLSVKVSDPNSIKFLKQCTSLVDLTSGDEYVIAGFTGESTYVLNAKSTDNQIQGILNSDSWTDSFDSTIKTMRADFDSYAMTISGDSENGYSLLDLNNKYLGYANPGSSKTNFARYDSDDSSNAKWAITYEDTYGSFKFASKANANRILSMNNFGKFGAYDVGNIDGKVHTNNQVDYYYYFVEIFKVVDLTSITKLSITCDGVGGNTTDWSTLKGSFEAISNISWKSYYKHASYEIGGSELSTVVTATNGTDADIAAFASKYDYIVHKYSKTGDNDFIQRSGTAYDLFKVTSNDNSSLRHSEGNEATIIIIIVSSVSLVSIAGYFVIRRKREN